MTHVRTDGSGVFDGFDARAYRAMHDAQGVARSYQRQDIGTEHLLLAMIMEGPNLVTRALISHGIALSTLVAHLRAAGSSSPAVVGDASATAKPGPAPDTGKAIRLAHREARRLGATDTSIEHLLLGIMREGDNTASQVLGTFGAKLDTVRGHVALALETYEISGATDSGATLSARDTASPEGLSPRMRRTRAMSLWLLRLVTALIVLAVLLFGLVWLVGIVHRADGITADLAAERPPWIGGWLLFVAVIVVASCAMHWSSLRRMLERRNRRFLAEEFLDREWEEEEGFEELNRLDYAGQAAVLSFSNAVARWAGRVRNAAVLIGGLWVWVTISSGLTRELIWWGVVILAVAVAAQLVRKPFAGFGVGNFTYPMRSSRVVPALTQGLHSGLSAFVGFVLLTPVIVLQTQLLATSPVWAGLSVSGLSGVVAVCEALTLAVTQAPLASAVLLFAVPLAVVILLHRLTEPALAVDVSEWLLPEDAPPALYLRTWESDAIPMRLRPVGSRFIDAVLPAKKSNFTESLGRNLSLIAPVALIGEPGTARQQGVGSMWSSDERWRELVESYAERALCTVFAASEVPPASGFSWEIELIGSGDTTGRVVIVFPPHFDFVRAFAPGGYLAEASRKPIFHGIEQAQPTERTVVMVRAKDGTWDCMDASVRDDSVYANCMFDLRLDNADGWENGVLGETDFPSTINAQRFVSTIASGLGWNPTLAATTVGWLYPALRQILILVRRAHQGKPLSGS